MNDPGVPEASVSRSELAARAAAQEQRNKPKTVLVIGALVLLAGLVYLFVGRSALADATAERRREVGSYRTVLLQKARLDAHRTGPQSGPSPFDPVENFTARAESAASSVGLTPVPTLSRQDEARDNDLVIRTYQYNRVVSRDLEALLGWVAQVESMVPGLEITRLELSPSRTQWQLVVTFVKPELPS